MGYLVLYFIWIIICTNLCSVWISYLERLKKIIRLVKSTLLHKIIVAGYFCLNCKKFSSFYKSWCSSLTIPFGVYIAHFNLICKTAALRIEEFVGKTRLRFLLMYLLFTDLKE